MGLGRVAAAKKLVDEKRGGGRKWLSISDGESVIVRPLEQGDDFQDVFVHRVPFKTDKDETKFVDVPCLDQRNKGVPCPGCKEDIERRYKFYLNVIVRDYEDEEEGTKEDTVMVWSGGINVATRLDKLSAKNKGLLNLDLEVERDGKGKKTKYNVDVESKGDMSEADKKLAEKKADLTRYITPPEFDDFFTAPWDRDNDDDDEGGKAKPNPFGRKRRNAAADDEEDGEDSGNKIKARIRSGGTSKNRIRRR